MLMDTILSRMPDLCWRVQADHSRDDNGHCRDCAGATRWPCELYRIAARADRMRCEVDGHAPASHRKPTRGGRVPGPRRLSQAAGKVATARTGAGKAVAGKAVNASAVKASAVEATAVKASAATGKRAKTASVRAARLAAAAPETAAS